MAEVALLFGVCLAGEGIAALLPVAFPASVVSMILLIALLLAGVVKERHIQRICKFLTANMAVFFIPACVGAMEYAGVIFANLLPIVGICFITTPLVYFVTAWTVKAVMALMRRGREAGPHA